MAEDRFGNTPLNDAVRERRSEVAEFLIEAALGLGFRASLGVGV